MVKFFIDPDDPQRRTRFAWSSDDEMRAGRVLIRIADHQAGRSALLAGGTRVVVPMVRVEHLEYLRPWFEHGAASFLARMRELGGEEEGWMGYRMSLKLYRFPRLSGVLSAAIKAKPLRVRRAARGGGGETEEFYRADDLRRAFRVNRDTVVYWASVGILPSDAFQPGQRSRISVDAFEKVKKLFEDSCSQKEAADSLGCTKQIVRKLILLGALKRASLLSTAVRDRVDVKSLQELSRYLLSRISPGSIQGQWVSFEEVVRTVKSAEGWRPCREASTRVQTT